MEEALLTANVADRGLGHGDAFESAGSEPGWRRPRGLHLLDVRDPDHVTDRQDPRDALAIHHREVPEATLTKDLEALFHGIADRYRDWVLGHDLLNLGGVRIDAVADRPEQVALTEHASQLSLRIEHRGGPDIGPVQDHRSFGEGDGGRYDHRRFVHHIGNGQRYGHGVSLALCTGPLGAPWCPVVQRGGAPERHDLATR
jgi:hypothetical protein